MQPKLTKQETERIIDLMFNDLGDVVNTGSLRRITMTEGDTSHDDNMR